MAKKDAALDVQDGGSTIVDFSNVDEPSFENLPKGNYNVMITDCDFGYSSKGNPMWTLKLSVMDGDFENRKLFNHITFSEAAMPFAKKTLAQIAPHLLESAFDPADTAVTEEFVNMECVAKVGLQKYDGDWRNNVTDLLKGDGGAFG